MMPHRESASLDPGSVKQCEGRTKERMQLVGTNRGKWGYRGRAVMASSHLGGTNNVGTHSKFHSLNKSSQVRPQRLS